MLQKACRCVNYEQKVNFFSPFVNNWFHSLKGHTIQTELWIIMLKKEYGIITRQIIYGESGLWIDLETTFKF